MLRTPAEALAWCHNKATSLTTAFKGLCLVFVQDAYAGAYKYLKPDATNAWYATTIRGTGVGPVGALHWWTGGEHGHGHVVVGDGKGGCYSSDFSDNAYVGDGRIRYLTNLRHIDQHDTLLHYQGWSRDLEGVVVVTLPTVSLKAVQEAARYDPSRPQGGTTSGAKDDVLVVEKALVAEGLLSSQYVDGSYGTKTKSAYAAWQRRLGYTGDAADGIPGQASLTKLGAKHYFHVSA